MLRARHAILPYTKPGLTSARMWMQAMALARRQKMFNRLLACLVALLALQNPRAAGCVHGTVPARPQLQHAGTEQGVVLCFYRASSVSIDAGDAAALGATKPVPANATVDTVVGSFVHGLPGSVFHTRHWNQSNMTSATYAAGEGTGHPWAQNMHYPSISKQGVHF